MDTNVDGWLKRQNPFYENVHVSHETIYRCLFIQARGVLKNELNCTCVRNVLSVARNITV